MSEKFTTPEGRLVGGHPLTRRTIVKKGVTQMQADGTTPVTECYMGFAILKTPGVDWKQEPWGLIIVAQALAGWPGGQSNADDFAWKVTDGDSTKPNTKGIAPNTREGYPGHWVLQTSTQLTVNAYHVGKYSPIDQIQVPAEINPGDYGRIQVEVKANNPAESPGVYLNPTLWEQRRSGEIIVLSQGADANAAFGDGQAATGAATGATKPAPAPDFLNQAPGAAGPGAAGPGPAGPGAAVEELFVNPNDGQKYTRAVLLAAKWPNDQIDAMTRG